MRRFAILAGTMLLSAGLVLSAGSSLAGEHGYIGANGCKICHGAKTGDQWNQWLNSAHAKAYETLKNEASAKIVADKGLKGNAWELSECLSCHVTAHGVDPARIGKKFAVEEGVGCESCHGPGSDYKAMSVMKSREASLAAGMIIPTEETCTACHNDKSPTFKGFEYAEALKAVVHPIPR